MTIPSSTSESAARSGSALGACIGCIVGRVVPLLDFGMQPPSNRYCRLGTTDTASHRLRLGQCSTCALIQLQDPMPPEMVRSRFSWVTYNEPEGHLDQLTERIARLDGIDAKSSAMGLSYKDDTTLARLVRRIGLRTHRIDAHGDLGIDAANAGLETLQSAIDRPGAQAIAARDGRASVLMVRHVLEHAHQPLAFLAALEPLVSVDGYLVIEVPDSRRFLDALDYSFVWEEHITYFTRHSLAALLARAGLEMIDLLEYPYPYEDSLVAIARMRRPAHRPDGAARIPADEWTRATRYGQAFALTRRRHQVHLARLRNDGKRIGVFGAGHLAAKFINFHDLAETIDCVIDDSPHKQGLAMPGSGLPIVSSGVLEDGRIDVCLSALSPESERNVLAKWPLLARDPSTFRSIFTSSERAILAPLTIAPAAIEPRLRILQT